MSRIGKNPVVVPADVKVELDGQSLTVSGPKGSMSLEAPVGINLAQVNNEIVVERVNNSKKLRAMHGTIRALIQNNVTGVKDGYTKELEIQGVGFKAVQKGQELVLALGYSHEINFKIPEGITCDLAAGGTEIKLSGCDKQVVGQAAAQIRSYYKAEPYKGKGVRYKGENVRRKAGKAVA